MIKNDDFLKIINNISGKIYYDINEIEWDSIAHLIIQNTCPSI